MRVLFDYYIFLNQKFGGVSRYFTELYKEYERLENVEIDIPIKYAMNEYLSTITSDYIKISESCNNNIYLMKMYAYLNQKYTAKYMKNNDYDIFHPTWYTPYIYEIGKKKKIVCTIHDMIQELFWQEKDQQTIARKKYAIMNSDAIIVDSLSTKMDILNLYPDVNEEKITVVHLGNNKLTHKVDDVDIELPARYFLYVGRRNDYKNGMFVVEALHKLVIETGIHILYIGGGKITDKENEIIAKYKIQNYVHQMNVSDAELSYIYSHAECFVFPSKYEGFGFPILEAFENNCPVVCTSSSSLPEVAGDAALYFSVDDFDECRKNVEALIADKNLRNTLIERGRKQVEKFTWKETARKNIEIYEKVLG